ncbi:MAG TPA: hypothetical protein VGQ46_23720 [Thermoanaerobaculia bacterium]|jgi:hypothetical protein|nr:hypothetical protein [Thermoanaerobaculia bacterium]
MSMRKLFAVVLFLTVSVIGGFVACTLVDNKLKAGNVKDEAMLAGRDAASMPGADEDYYADMDYGLTKNPEGIRASLDPYLPGVSAADAVKRVAIGRNNWVVWTAGNDRLWDVLSVSSLGNLDLLKTISSHPSLQNKRSNRWSYLGLVNEPCFRQATGPRNDRFGLWIDERVQGAGCGPDPFENEQKYPGVKIGARGKNIPVGSYYGYATGVVGLRLFPNPNFDEAAQKRWDPVRYYTDKTYYNDAKLVKPFRVGMSCGFCHVGPNPSNPPADPENPTWANLNSNPGAQYFWIERIFMFDQDQGSYIWQLFHTSRPGALDTSLVSSDEINNPRTMNAIYNLGARLEIGRKWGQEQLARGSADNKQFNDYVPAGTALGKFYDPATHIANTTHVLKDGSDSVGALGALNRVYLNIGLFSEEWLLHFVPMVGGAHVSPIKIADAEKNSTYWRANVAQTPNTALFFLATAKPDYLKVAPGGAGYMTDEALIPHGKEVFGERCARCHSSKLPEKVFNTYFKPGCIGPNYMKCWNDYWTYTKTPEFKAEMKQIVMAPDFLDNNYLSNEVRVPVTLMETNACSPLATNALRDNIWDNFSSEAYKNLPSVGKVMIHHPYTAEASWYEMPGGGRGFTRPASLISLWSTAPYLQNNSVGHFEESGSVADRMSAFDDGITQMLWPEKRKGNGTFATQSGKSLPGWVDRTTQRSYVSIAPGYVPDLLKPLADHGENLSPNLFYEGGIRIGPIPEGTPVGLLTNIDLSQQKNVVELLVSIKRKLHALPAGATDDEARKVFAPLVPQLLGVSKCADFVVNKGHYFGTDYLPASEGEPGLTDADKRALIAFLKTF